MFKDIMNLGSMMKKAQELSGKMEEMKSQMKHLTADGTAGGGMVEVKINGQFELMTCKVDPALVTVDNKELLEDMIVAAVNNASQAIREKMESEMGDMTSGLDISGLLEEMKK